MRYSGAFATDTQISDVLAEVAAQVLRDPVALLGQKVADDFELRVPQVHRGLLISGARFVSTAAESALLRRALPDALAVEMMRHSPQAGTAGRQ